MTRLTLDELNARLSEQTIVESWYNVTRTRQGVYIKTQIGLAANTYFVGLAIDEERVVIEEVS